MPLCTAWYGRYRNRGWQHKAGQGHDTQHSAHSWCTTDSKQHKAGQYHYTENSVHSWCTTGLVQQATQSRLRSSDTAFSPFCRQHKAGQGHYTRHSVHSAGNTKQARVITHGTQSIHGAQLACSIEDSPLLLCTGWEVILTQGDNTKYQINPHV